MKHPVRTAAVALAGVLTGLALTGSQAEARPVSRWHAAITQITRVCGGGAVVYFQLERLDGDSWDQPLGTWPATVQTRAGQGWRTLGRTRTAAIGTAGTFYTADPAATQIRVQAPDGTWSFPVLGGDLCEPLPSGVATS